jgi:hypothetical protein
MKTFFNIIFAYFLNLLQNFHEMDNNLLVDVIIWLIYDAVRLLLRRCEMNARTCHIDFVSIDGIRMRTIRPCTAARKCDWNGSLSLCIVARMDQTGMG